MADCNLPQNWNLPACAAGLPVMETRPTNPYAAPPRPTAPAPALVRPAPGSVITGGGPNWLLIALGAGAAYYLANRSKPGLAGPDDEAGLSGPRRRTPRPAPKAAPTAAPKPAPRVARPRTHGQHLARLVIS